MAQGDRGMDPLFVCLSIPGRDGIESVSESKSFSGSYDVGTWIV